MKLTDKTYKPKAVRNKNGEIIAYQLRAARIADDGTRLIPFSENWKIPSNWNELSTEGKVSVVNRANTDFLRRCNTGLVEVKSEKMLRLAKEESAKKEKAKKDITVREAAKRFVDARSENKSKYKDNTTSQYNNNLRFALDLFGDKKIANISNSDVNKLNALLSKLENEGVVRKNGTVKKYVRGSIIKYYAATQALFEWAKDEGYVDENVFVGAKPQYEDGTDGSRTESHTQDEIKAILNLIKAEDIMWQVLFNLSISTGARRGECIGIEWTDISYSERSILLTKQLQYNKERTYYYNPLKGKRSRVIYPNDTFFDLLAIYRQQLIDVFGKANLPKYVFYNLRGDHRLKPAEFTDYCKELSHKINMHITPHKFRHTLATLMVKSGESIVTVADAIGDGIEIAYKFYCNDKEKQKQEASRRFNKNFEESGS